MAGTARLIVSAATALMPPGRRDWGRAIAAELDHADSAGDRALLVLGALNVALLPPPGLGDYGRASVWAARVAVVAYLPLGAWACLVSVLLPGRGGAGGVLPLSYVLVTTMAAGALARRAPARPGRAVIAGVSAGLVLGGLFLATLASQGGAVDAGVLGTLCLAGAAFGPIGSALGRELASAPWQGLRAGFRPRGKRPPR